MLTGVSMLAIVGANGGPIPPPPTSSVIGPIDGSRGATTGTKPFLQLAQALKGDTGDQGPTGPKGDPPDRLG